MHFNKLQSYLKGQFSISNGSLWTYLTYYIPVINQESGDTFSFFRRFAMLNFF